MIIPKKIQKDYQLTIATIIKAMFHHSDSIVRFYKWSMRKGTILNSEIIIVIIMTIVLLKSNSVNMFTV